METSTTKNRWNSLGLTLSAFTALSFVTASQPAAAVSLGGYTWNAANAVTSGVHVPGSQDIDSFSSLKPLNAANTVAGAMGLSRNRLVILGDSTLRTIVQLDWGGALLTNRSGNDLVVYESGNAKAPEAFGIAIRRQGQTDFTNFLYRFSTSYTPESELFATAFDLSDFGLGEGDAIDAIRIANLIGTDGVSGDGQGFLGGGSAPTTGPQGTGQYSSGRFDPDIAYVVGLHDMVPSDRAAVGEPASIVSLLAFGVLGVGGILKRKQQQKA